MRGHAVTVVSSHAAHATHAEASRNAARSSAPVTRVPAAALAARGRRRLTLRALVVAAPLLLASVPATVVAQFPDIRQMSGTPLPSPELPDGTVSVRVVRESLANNLVGVSVTLTGGRTQTAPTDAEGRAIFSGIAAGTSIQAEVTVNGERVSSRSFAMPAQGGVRLILALGIDGQGGAAGASGTPGSSAGAPGDAGAAGAAANAPIAGRVVLGAQTRTIVEIIDGALEVFHVFEIANVADRPVDVGAPIEFRLPEDARTVTLLEGSTSQARVFEKALVVAGPFASGRTMAQVAYRVAYSGPTARIDVPLPLPVIQTNLIVRLLGDTRVVSPTLPQSRVAQAEGRTYWTATGPGLNAGDTLTVELAGLPHHPAWPRYTALGLAGAVMLVGVWFAWLRPVDPSRRIAALEARRARLLDEVRRLDAGGDGPAGASDRRAALLRELEGLYVLLDAERERQPTRAGVARPA